MTLFLYLICVVVAIGFIYIWKRGVGVLAILLAFVIPFVIYEQSGLSLQTFAWSWAIPLLIGLIIIIPAARFVYVKKSRLLNHWSPFNMEIVDDEGHLHYVKGINQGSYVNGGSGSGKTASCNVSYARHAAHFGMSVLAHDFKKFELSECLYPIFKAKKVPYHVFAIFDPERSVRVNPIAPEYLPDEASMRARVKSFITAAQGRDSSDSTSDFFNNASASLLEAVIWYLRRYKPEYCNLPFVMAILNSPDNLHLSEGKKMIPFGKLEQMLRRDTQVYSMAASFLQGAGNMDTTSNILQTVLLALNTINTDEGYYLLSKNDLDLRINKPGVTTVLALVNDTKNSTAYAPILATIADAVLTMMSERGGSPAVALLDEAPELPILRIQNYMATLRSLGICIVYTTQDLSQIQRTQGGKEYNLHTVLSNLAHQFLGRTSLEKTAKYYEGMMPQVDRAEKSHSSSSHGGSISTRTVKKPLYEKTEFYTLQTGEFIYFHGKVERFRFEFSKQKKEIPPKIREINRDEMQRIAKEIRQEAAEFMNSFQTTL